MNILGIIILVLLITIGGFLYVPTSSFFTIILLAAIFTISFVINVKQKKQPLHFRLTKYAVLASVTAFAYLFICNDIANNSIDTAEPFSLNPESSGLLCPTFSIIAAVWGAIAIFLGEVISSQLVKKKS